MRRFITILAPTSATTATPATKNTLESSGVPSVGVGVVPPFGGGVVVVELGSEFHPARLATSHQKALPLKSQFNDLEFLL